MTIDDLSELLKFIQKNNSWEQASYLFRHRKQPKYIDCKVWFTLDTRDGIIFYIKFRQSGKDKSFSVENKHDLDKVYKYLNEGDEGDIDD